MEPQVAIAQPDAEVLLGEAKGAQALDEERDKLNLGFRARLAEDIRVQLVEAPSPSLLHALVPVEIGDVEPLDRPLEGAGALADQPADAGRHFRTKRDLALPLVSEAEKLTLYLVA